MTFNIINNIIKKITTYVKKFIKSRFNIDFISIEEKAFYYIISITLLVDFLNGFLITYTGISNFTLGKVFRIGIIILSFIYLLKYDYKRLIKIVILSIPLLLSSIISVYLSDESLSVFIYDVNEIIRLFYLIFIINGFILLAKQSKVRLCIVNKSIINNAIILVPILMVSLILNIGDASYDGAVGYKSTFASLNALTASLLFILTFVYDEIYKNKQKIISLILFIVVSLFLLLLGSKSGYIIGCTILILYAVLETDKENKKKQLKFMISSFILIIVLLFTVFKKAFDEILARQLHFIANNKDTFMTYLLSGRNELLGGAIDSFRDDSNIRRALIGVGSFNEQIEIAKNLPLKYNNILFKNIEMDIFDILFSYGIYGVAITYGFVTRIFYKCISVIDMDKQRPYIISFIVLIIYSILGGHVFNEAMSSTFLGVSLLGLMLKTK